MAHPRSFQPHRRGALLFLLTLAASLGWHQQSQAQGSSNNTFTTSTSSHITTTSVTLDQRQSSGLIQNILNGGDKLRIGSSLNRSLNDPKVQAALKAALKVLNKEKPAFPQGATLHTLSRSLGSGGSSSTTTQTLGTQLTVTLEDTIGPGTIIIGDRDQGGTAFEVLAGTSNTNVNSHTGTFNQQLTTLSGGAATVETLLRQRILFIDLGAVYSTLYSGLPLAQAQRASLLAAHSAIGDVNSRIFRAMLGPNDSEAPQGDGSLGDDVRVFTSGGAGWLSQDGNDSSAGLRDTRESVSMGAEWKLNPVWRAGFAASYIHSDTDFSDDLGSQQIDGGALSVYATWRKDPWYADLLYSAGLFNNSTHRNTLVSGTANGGTDDWSHLVSLNLGYVIKVTDTFATGPYAALTYAHGNLNGYSEQGGGTAALNYGAQSYNSLVSDVGWQASWKLRRSWGSITPLLRVGWERENLPDTGDVSATLLTSPFGIVTGGGVQRFGGFGATANRESACYNALSVDAGVSFEIGERWTLVFNAAERTDFGPRNDFSIALTAGYRF